MACDPFWDKTVLACHFDGANGSTTFTDEKGHTLTANGNAQLTTTSPKFGTACATFDGTGGYISIATTDLVVGTGDITVETWFYISALPGQAYAHVFDTRTSDGTGFALGVQNDGKVFLFSINAFRVQAGSVNVGAWNHLAMVRAAGVTKVFLNGSQAGADWANTTDYAQTTVLIGKYYASASYPFAGCLDDLRITKAARYTANFTPDTAAFLTNQCTISGTVKDSTGANAQRLVRAHKRDSGVVLNISQSNASTGAYSLPVETTAECFVMAHDVTGDPLTTNVKLALKMDIVTTATNFVDEMGKTVTANGDAKLVSGAAPYGRAAAYFDGTGDYLSVPYSTDFEVGSGDFTIEFWFKVPNVSGQKTLFAFNADFHIGIFLNSARMNCFASSNGSSWDIMSGDSGGNYGAGYTDVTANVWHHFAWTRSGSTWTMWLDGKLDRQLTGYTQTVFSRNEAFNIGRWGNAGYWMTGYIDDFRFIKGTCLYAAPFELPLPDFLTLSGGTENAVILDRVVPA